ncbi:MAG: hypothetical protein AB1393_10820 [Candidatus Edwardsbacteria bacterium]
MGNSVAAQESLGWKSSIEKEIQLFAEEAKQFLVAELQYVGIVSKTLANSETKNPLILYGETWANCVREYLNVYFDREESDLRSGDFNHLLRTTSLLRLMPIMMQNYTTELVSRRARSPKLAGNALVHSFPLGEVHPDFAEAIQSIETLNCWLHNRVSAFFGRLRSIPPILAVSAFERYTLQPFPWQLPVDLQKLTMEWVLTMSWITLPRWTPAQIRYCPAIAHEHFHRIEYLLKAACDYLKENRNSCERTEDTILSDIKKLLGSNFLLLLESYTQILTSLTDFFRTVRKESQDWMGRGIEHYGHFLEDCHFRIFEKAFADSALRWTGEFLADVCATVLLGPAYLWAFLNRPSAWQTATISLVRLPGALVTHPPPCVRRELMLRLLRESGGFQRIPDDIKKQTQELKKRFSHIEADNDPACRSLAFWLNQNFNLFVRACETLSDTMTDTCWKKIKEEGEKVWLEKLQSVWGQLKTGTVFFGDSVSIDRIINALWWKELYTDRKEEMSGHIGWRLALSGALSTITRGGG